MSLLAGAALATSSARPYVGMATESGDLVRWFHPALTFTLGATTSSDVDASAMPDVMLALFDKWVDTSCGLVPEVTFAGNSPATSPTHPGATPTDNVLLFANTSADWAATKQPNSVLAITLVARNEATGQIADADFVINGAGHKFTLADTPSAGEIRLQNVMLHEAGHFFGLDHSRENSAIMFASFDNLHEALTQDDVDGICAQYTNVPPLPTPKDDGGGCTAGGASLLGLAFLALRRRRDSSY